MENSRKFGGSRYDITVCCWVCVPSCCSLTDSLFPDVSHREGAIDRLVNIYKDVVHKTGVSVATVTQRFLLCFSFLLLSSLRLSVGLPDRERLRQPGASRDDHAGGGRGRGQHLQETQRGRRKIRPRVVYNSGFLIAGSRACCHDVICVVGALRCHLFVNIAFSFFQENFKRRMKEKRKRMKVSKGHSDFQPCLKKAKRR